MIGAASHRGIINTVKRAQPVYVPRLANYMPVLHQALRDVSARVQRGVPPPSSTHYEVVDAQVSVPDDAASLGGIQPVVHMTVDGAPKTEISVNTPLRFKGEIEIPGGGMVIATEWYFGDAPVAYEASSFTPSEGKTVAVQTHTFTKPGTYFVTPRAKAQRDESASDAVVPANLAQVRIAAR